MHPSPLFRPHPAALLARAAEIGFAHLFVATADGPMVAHVPLTLHGRELRFHLSRANRLHPHLARATVLASVAGPHGYISPNWYVRPGNQVPTWNYETIEIEGAVRPICDAALLDQLDTLANTHEPRPEPWTRAKADPAVIASMLRAIEGFALTPTAVRGTTKLSQNKGGADRAAVAAGLMAQGNTALGAMMA